MRPDYKRRFFRQCDAEVKLSIKGFRRQLNIKIAFIIRFQFHAFLLYATIPRNTNLSQKELHVNTDNIFFTLAQFQVWYDSYLLDYCLGQEAFRAHLGSIYLISLMSPSI